MINSIRHRLQQFDIQSRIIGILLMAVTLSFCFFAYYSYHVIPRDVTEEVNRTGNAIGMSLATSVRQTLIEGNFDELHQVLEDLVRDDKNIIKIDIEDAKKNVIISKKSADDQSNDARLFVFPVIKKSAAFEPLSNEAESPVSGLKKAGGKIQSENIVGYIQMTYSPDALILEYTQVALHRLSILLLCIAVSLIMPYWLIRTVTVPIKNAIKALKTIRDGKYNLQVEVTTQGEMGEMQKTINQITINLDESIVELENKVTARTIELQKSRDAIVKSDSEKRRLIQKVQSIVEEERKSIATEIHDELNATLIAAKLSSQNILSLASADAAARHSGEIKEHALNIIQLTTDLYSSARNIVRRLRPEILDMLGLEGAINDMIENYNAMHPQCHLDFTSEGDLTTIPANMDITVYRLIQEALSNVLKHAQATQAHVFVRNDEKNRHLLVTITDNGKGFSPKKNEAGIGIIGMRERVYAFHGEMDINSQEGHGTTVSVSFPLSDDDPG